MEKKEFKKKFDGQIFYSDVMRQYYTRAQMAEIKQHMFESQTFLPYQGGMTNCWLRTHPKYQGMREYRGQMVMDDGAKLDVRTGGCEGYPVEDPMWYDMVEFRYVVGGDRGALHGAWIKMPAAHLDGLIDKHRGLETKLSPQFGFGFDGRYYSLGKWDGAQPLPLFILDNEPPL
jgi:hypothetical protein